MQRELTSSFSTALLSDMAPFWAPCGPESGVRALYPPGAQCVESDPSSPGFGGNVTSICSCAL